MHIADCIAPSQQLADELTNCSGLKGEHLELTLIILITNLAAELTTLAQLTKSLPSIDSADFQTEGEHCLLPVKRRPEFEQSSLSITCSRGLCKCGWRIGNAAAKEYPHKWLTSHLANWAESDVRRLPGGGLHAQRLCSIPSNCPALDL